MQREVTISIVNNRFRCAWALRKMAVSEDSGLISEVKLQRMSLLIWHLEYKVMVKL